MKRGAPLKRYKGLPRTPLKRSPSRGRNRGAKSIPPRVRRQVEARAMGRCEIAATSRCEGRGYHCHHIQLRSQGGPHTVLNLLLTCAPCHTYVHAHPRLAHEQGWILPRPPLE